jgi:hypothetical protein
MWVDASWGFAKQIMPLLLAGVLVAGFLLGGPGAATRGVVPGAWVEGAVGGNSLLANAFASFVGAFMYFATLTEVPILEGLINSGMGKGPALALLLAGPALSLPNMLVIRSVLGTRRRPPSSSPWWWCCRPSRAMVFGAVLLTVPAGVAPDARPRHDPSAQRRSETSRQARARREERTMVIKVLGNRLQEVPACSRPKPSGPSPT